MSYKIKSLVYLASFTIAVTAYYHIGQQDAQELAMSKEIAKIENQTVATPSAAEMYNLR